MPSTSQYTLVRNTRRYIQRADISRPASTANDTIPVGSVLEFPATGDQEVYDGEQWVRMARRNDPQLEELIVVLTECRDLLGELRDNQ